MTKNIITELPLYIFGKGNLVAKCRVRVYIPRHRESVKVKWRLFYSYGDDHLYKLDKRTCRRLGPFRVV